MSTLLKISYSVCRVCKYLFKIVFYMSSISIFSPPPRHPPPLYPPWPSFWWFDFFFKFTRNLQAMASWSCLKSSYDSWYLKKLFHPYTYIILNFWPRGQDMKFKQDLFMPSCLALAPIRTYIKFLFMYNAYLWLQVFMRKLYI